MEFEDIVVNGHDWKDVGILRYGDDGIPTCCKSMTGVGTGIAAGCSIGGGSG